MCVLSKGPIVQKTSVCLSYPRDRGTEELGLFVLSKGPWYRRPRFVCVIQGTMVQKTSVFLCVLSEGPIVHKSSVFFVLSKGPIVHKISVCLSYPSYYTQGPPPCDQKQEGRGRECCYPNQDWNLHLSTLSS